MNEGFVLDAVVGAVPQWYSGFKAAWMSELRLGVERRTICSHRAPAAKLDALLCFVQENLDDWHAQLKDPVSPSQVAAIRKAVALRWLGLHDERVDWPRLLAYMEYLKDRTLENRPLSRNLVIASGCGEVDITSFSLQKVLDPLAGCDHAYLKVDSGLRFLGYEEIGWNEIREDEQYSYSVDFLRTFSHCVADGGYLAHLTPWREIVVLSREGLLAAERRNRWYVHDSTTLRDSLVDIFEDPHIGGNLYEIIIDLSYKRHGALLVYDPTHRVVGQVINRESVLVGGSQDEAHRLLAPVARQIALGSSTKRDVKKRLLMEMATLDGAVIFDADAVLAFGAMIRTHPDAGGVVGARTTAAVSAYLDGGTTVKVSSDGDVCILFSEGAEMRTTERVKLQFL